MGEVWVLVRGEGEAVWVCVGPDDLCVLVGGWRSMGLLWGMDESKWGCSFVGEGQGYVGCRGF